MTCLITTRGSNLNSMFVANLPRVLLIMQLSSNYLSFLVALYTLQPGEVSVK